MNNHLYLTIKEYLIRKIKIFSKYSTQFYSLSPEVNCKAHNKPFKLIYGGERMEPLHFDSSGIDTEVINTLNAISYVSARMARNMSLLANLRQAKEGNNKDDQNKRYGYDYPRITQCSHYY